MARATRRASWLGHLCLAGLLLADGRAADADDAPTPWALATAPSHGPAAAIGGYSAGCVAGAVALPANGPGFQRMRPSRKRFFGHPQLIAFIKALGHRVHEAGVGPILIGDLGQPKGGPAPNGHSSHQSGLDVDISLWHPRVAEKRRLTRKEREHTSARSVVDTKHKQLNDNWSEDMTSILRLTAEDERVARIFVNPVIKKHLCDTLEDDRGFLHKLRPWYGHDDHMHVRLRCPEGNALCEDQAEPGQGDGCEGLDWWLDDKAQAERKKGHKTYQAKVGATPELPPSCADLVTAAGAK